jgi:ATP-binding cassette subfamily F protein 3
VEYGHNVKVGYTSQYRGEQFTPGRTVLEEAMDLEQRVPEQMVRNLLGSFLFRGEDVNKPTTVLSGGEKTRLGICKILLNPPNFLLMDEPTTHLDIGSIEALIGALEQFEGTLVFISHDVFFIRAMAKKVLHISAGQLTPYAGDYQYYLDKSRAENEREALTAGEKLTDSRPEQSVALKGGGGSLFKSKDQKRAEAEARQARSKARKKLEEKVSSIEGRIEKLEARQREIVAKLEDPSTYEKRSESFSLNQELLDIQSQLEACTAEWEAASEALTAAAE